MKNLVFLEYRRFYKNYCLLLIGAIILLSALISSPVFHSSWSTEQAVAHFTENLKILILCAIPWPVAVVLKENTGVLTNHILYSQPIRIHSIASGKWFAVISLFFFASLASMLLFALSPLFIGQPAFFSFKLVSDFAMVVAPIIFTASLLSAILFMLFRSIVISYVGMIIMTLLAGYAPAIFDVTLFAPISFILLLTVYFGLYYAILEDKEITRENKRRKYKRKVRKICYSYNKTILLKGFAPVTAVMLILCIYAFIKNDLSLWTIIHYALVLLPGYILIPIHSEIYGNKREGVIYTSSTPKYKILIERFAYGAIVSESFIAFVYAAAFLFGLETGLGNLLILLSGGLLLALTGLTAANMTRVSMAGYTAALLLWSIAPLNLADLGHMLWPVFFLSISVMLFILNVSVIKARET
ncbi:hypothetical protein [Paenibacillus aceti]|nr:hypothetical protein [Paenibacillus aceti]